MTKDFYEDLRGDEQALPQTVGAKSPAERVPVVKHQLDDVIKPGEKVGVDGNVEIGYE